MKKIKIAYWIFTSLIALNLIMAGTMYFTNPEVSAGFAHLGFPDYFRIELGIAKLVGAVVLILPFLPRNVKEWVYAGAGITFISAAIAHGNAGDPASGIVTPLVMFALLAASYYFYTKLPARVRTQQVIA
ncbi:MAG TPA: DoxX family protein [Bacteroidia bacterium]|nr:DoxX family protein [Bacteroidia bacterium]